MTLYQLSIVLGILLAYFANWVLLQFSRECPDAFGGQGWLHWTMVAEVHSAFFPSLEAIADAKAEILDGATPSTVVIANAADPLGTLLRKLSSEHPADSARLEPLPASDASIDLWQRIRAGFGMPNLRRNVCPHFYMTGARGAIPIQAPHLLKALVRQEAPPTWS